MRRISEVLWCCLSMERIDAQCHMITNPENGSRKTQSKYLVIKKKRKREEKYEEARYFSLIKGGICSAKAFGYR